MGHLAECLRVEDIAQVAQSFPREVVWCDVVRGDECLYFGAYVESATIRGNAEGGKHCAKFTVRTLVAAGAIPVEVCRPGLIKEPTDRAQQSTRNRRRASEIVCHSGQDLVSRHDVLMGFRESAVLTADLRVEVVGFGHRRR